MSEAGGTLRLDVNPEVFLWAIERSGQTVDEAIERTPRLAEWLSEENKPTFKQVEKFSSRIHAPLGYFLSGQLPQEELQIPDMRTIRTNEVAKPSGNLLDTIYDCERRQNWFVAYCQAEEIPGPRWFGSASLEEKPAVVVQRFRQSLGLENGSLEKKPGRSRLRTLVEIVEDQNVLVMVNGVVGNSTSRKLDVNEFRGFCLASPVAPVIFINGLDSENAKVFTLCHVLGYLVLGHSALSDAKFENGNSARREERWCNEFAAEFLVPSKELEELYLPGGDIQEQILRLARRFGESTAAIALRLGHLGLLSNEEVQQILHEQIVRFEGNGSDLGESRSRGGNFYNLVPQRVSRRFARALIVSAKLGETSFTEAFRMLGIRKQSTFDGIAQQLGV